MTGGDYEIAKVLFDSYLGKTFSLQTFLGSFSNRHFIHKEHRNSLRLACMPFFKELAEGQVTYLTPVDENTIVIFDKEPIDKETQPKVAVPKMNLPPEQKEDVVSVVLSLVKENMRLRQENEELIKYKDRLEKYQNLDYIFEGEKFMEDWLERNIHKALASLEIIDRQPIITWNEHFMLNKPDFFCLDKTTKEFVVVENKVRGRHRKVETQYLTYKAWVKRNLDAINEKYKDRGLKATNNFRFVIITDTTDERLEAICEDSSIALVLIDGGVVFEEVVPYGE